MEQTDGFAFVPHTCRFLGQQSSGVELRVKGSNLHLVRPNKNSASAVTLKRKVIALGNHGRRGDAMNVLRYLLVAFAACRTVGADGCASLC
jgi:hypothetical protein